MDPYSYTAFISSFWAQDFHISTEDPLERPPKIPIASSISENIHAVIGIYHHYGCSGNQKRRRRSTKHIS